MSVLICSNFIFVFHLLFLFWSTYPTAKKKNCLRLKWSCPAKLSMPLGTSNQNRRITTPMVVAWTIGTRYRWLWTPGKKLILTDLLVVVVVPLITWSSLRICLGVLLASPTTIHTHPVECLFCQYRRKHSTYGMSRVSLRQQTVRW